jgi:hydroxypyruvate isomerase
MPRFSANLSMLFGEHDFLDRFDAAARAGFKGVEYIGPYDHPPEVVAARLKKNGLTQVLFNLPAGDWAAGDRGMACDPRRADEFYASVQLALEYATELGVKQVHCMAGKTPAGLAPERARETFIDNLRHSADAFAPHGIRVLIEPINHYDIPGYFLNHSQQALDIIAAAARPNLFLQYDIYHMQRMEGELSNTIRAHLPMIKHMQLADTPGRHEPGTGEINYRYLFSFLDELGYDGWIGCEYNPKNGTAAGLGWRTELAPQA